MNTKPGEWIYDPVLKREVTTVRAANSPMNCDVGAAPCLHKEAPSCFKYTRHPGTDAHVIWVDRTTWPIARLTGGGR